MVYQLMFAIITPALISGAFAERMKFSAMLAFMVLWALFVYSPMAHMVWGKGGLLNATLGGRFPCLDFRRRERSFMLRPAFQPWSLRCTWASDWDTPRSLWPPHSVVLSFIGACLLWVGWFGFNAGSGPGAQGTLATSAFVATHFGAAAAALSWSAAEWLRQRTRLGSRRHFGRGGGAGRDYTRFRVRHTYFGPLRSGLIAGAFCYFMVVKVKAIFGYDDSLDAFGVHGAGGTMGAILTGIFANSVINPIYGAGKATGLLEGNGRQLVNQIIGIAIAWTLSIVGTTIILFVVDKTIGLRVDEETERIGLDLSQHGEEGYDLAA